MQTNPGKGFFIKVSEIVFWIMFANSEHSVEPSGFAVGICVWFYSWLTAQQTTDNKEELLWLYWKLYFLEPLRVALIISFDITLERKSALFLFGPSFFFFLYSFWLKMLYQVLWENNLYLRAGRFQGRGKKRPQLDAVPSNSDLLGDNPKVTFQKY